MFYSTNNLNEGGCHDKCAEGRKRELKEGKDPRTADNTWNAASPSAHVNSKWQKLRK